MPWLHPPLLTHKQNLVSFSICLLLLLFAVLECRQARAADLDLRTILQVLRDRETALRCYRLECGVEGRIRDMSLENISFQTASGRLTYWGDVSGRVRCDVQWTRIATKGDSRQESWLAAFDGEAVRRQNERNGRARGRTTSDRSQALFLGVDPLNFVVRIGGRTGSEFLSATSAQLKGGNERKTDDVILIESGAEQIPFEGIKLENVHRSYLAPTYGFAVVRDTGAYRVSPSGPWRSLTDIRCDRFTQDSSGLWLPQHVVIQSYGLMLDVTAPQERALLSRVELNDMVWTINPDLPDSTYDLTFRPNTIVKDEVAGRTFKTAQVTDQMIADQVNQVERVRAGELPESVGWWARRHVVYLSLAILGVCLLGVALRWYLRPR